MRQRVDRQALLQLEIQELENAGNLKCYSLWRKTTRTTGNDILKGKLVRSRAKWIQRGEKPTNYFL